MSLDHLIWLDLSQRLRNVYLCEHHQVYTALHHLPRPESQTPQLITMLGDRTKSLFIENCFSLQSKTHKKILLHSVPAHFSSNAPLFVADCELHNALTPSALVETKTAGGIESHSLKWLRNIPREMGPFALAHLVYTKLLLPFSTVVCIFASDFAGTDKVARFLTSWLKLRSRQPIFSSSTFARILIFIKWNGRGTFDEKLATIKFIKQLRLMVHEDKGLHGPLGDESLTDVEFEKFLKDNVFELRLLALPEPGDNTHLETIRTRLLCESEEIYNFRKVAKIAFSARHFQAFLQLACRHFSTDIVSQFDMVRASRIANPVPTDFSSHIANFIACIPGEHQNIIPRVIASALYLDSFPPGAHVFDPELLFDTLYSKLLEAGLSSLPNCEGVIQDIKADFCSDRDYVNTAWIHKRNLKLFSDVWIETFSNVTCLSCLARAPNSTLPCKHSLCDTCVVIHGREDVEEPWKFLFDSCSLCEAAIRASVLIKPPTAGTRCAVFDGGLYNVSENLETLEKMLQLPMNIGDFFDIVNGSGIGVWVMLEKFYENEKFSEDNPDYQNIKCNILDLLSPPSSQVSRFSAYSSTIQSNEVGIALKRLEGVFKGLPRWSVTLAASLKVQSSLNNIFGDKTLFECHNSSTRLCITVSRSKDSATCILSNYNGDGRRPKNYKHVRERKMKNEVQLSQCARMSLTSKSVHGYQVKDRDVPNEMIDIVVAEQDLLWARQGRAPDIVLALGTSIAAYDRPLRPEKTPDWLIDFRLQATNRLQLESSVDALLASSFYIELVGVPQLDELGHFFCQAQIRCRILPSSKVYPVLINRMQKRRARFYYEYQSIPCINRQLSDEAGRGISFSRSIEMSLPTLQHSIDVKIDGLTRSSHRISNCPYRLQQIIEDQGLHCMFGNRDHKRRFLGMVTDPKPQARFI